MATSTTKTNKPLNPRGNDQSPLAYNRAKLFSGKALDFDGVNDEVSGPNSFSETTHSISAYIQTSSASAYKSIFEFRDSGADGGVLWVLPGNNLVYQINGVSTTNFYINADEWYHVVGTYDGTNQSIYINGNLWETKTNSGSVSVSANWKIGSRSFSTGSNWFDGMIGGVKAYSTALTATQVADLYNNPEKIVPTGVEDTALKLWLPMMEGAGTTAYDGSGNGNHGTISGATYVNGVGAPVAQSAVIDWNKGTNEFQYSEEFNNSYWTKVNTSITANQTTAPDGQTTADSIDSTASNELIYRVVNAGTYSFSVYAKAGTTTSLQLASTQSFNGRGADFDLANGTAGAVYQIGSGNADITGGTSAIESVGNGWYRCSINSLTLTASRALTIANNNGNLSYIWGASVEQSATAGPYVRTDATAQTSPVLLPQGLTTGRDITGVNLFENVRKQGALNLDGNSWAEVHDNASLDITDAITLEAWVYWDDSVSHGFLGKWDYSSGKASYLILKISATKFRFYVSSTGSNASLIENGTTITNGWNHIVGVYDGTNIKCYLNGSVDGSTAYSAGLFPNDLNLEIGKYGSVKYPNDIAQPRIYNRALTAEEVERNYNAGKNIYK